MPTKPSVDARQQRHHWPKDYASCIAFQGRITPKALHYTPSYFLALIENNVSSWPPDTQASE